MTHFHAVLTDETGCEFGAGVDADSRDEAYNTLREDYPESRVVQLESPQDSRDREARIYASISREYDDGGYYEQWED
jgi:hypothetical protein